MMRLQESHKVAFNENNNEQPLTLNSWQNELLAAEKSSWDTILGLGQTPRHLLSNRSMYVMEDAINWLSMLPDNSIHAIVTDPPYGLIEYEKQHLAKKREGKGGVWRIPPSFDGVKRSPLPRFTVLKNSDIAELHAFFGLIASEALRVLAPGGHMVMASNPLLSTITFHAIQESGFEKRGEIIRLVQTLRGGDRPKGSEAEFQDVSVMPRSAWEPWGLFRKPFKGTVANNLRKWGTGGFKRNEDGLPFKDVISCSPTRGLERKIAPHPSLKPQRFMRQLVRAVLPLGIGIVYDPFAGSGSTLAAANAVGYRSLGSDRDLEYFRLSREAFEGLTNLEV